jgi:hypothetical protein
MNIKSPLALTRAASIASIIAIIQFQSQARAQSPVNYYTDFYTNNSGYQYTGNQTIVGQDGWYTSSTDLGPGVVANLNYLGQANSFTLGGSYYSTYSPDQNTYPTGVYTYLSRDFALNTNSMHFDTTFFVYPGTNSAKDTFGWTAVNAQGYQLMSVDLNPVVTNGATTYSLGVTSFANDSSLNSQALTGTNGVQLPALLANSWYHLGFNINNIGTAEQSVSVYNYYTNGFVSLVGSTSIAGYDFSNSQYNNGNTNIAALAATWELKDTTSTTGTNGQTIYPNYGDNTLVMNTLAVSTVPETKTTSLLILSGVFIATVILRKRAY